MRRDAFVDTAHRGLVIKLAPNRVWRSYRGGATLDSLAGRPAPADGNFPEDWIGSLTSARNPGPSRENEGLSAVEIEGRPRLLRTLVSADPEYFFGRSHLARFGEDPRLLVKFLDPAIRLHFQVHPSAAFARDFLGSPSGKTEAYHVLGVRPGCTPRIFIGFQRPPTRDALRRMIETQDIADIAACFDPIDVKPGDTFIVPGGTPHALGEGLFVVEVQEPSDLVVRFEFERGGYVLPEEARFMGRGLEFCLDVFDMSLRGAGRLEKENRCRPRPVRDLGPGSRMDELIGPEETDRFRLARAHLGGPAEWAENCFTVGIVTGGACRLRTGRGDCRVGPHEAFLLPAGLGPVGYAPEPLAELLFCQPPDPAG